MEATAHPNIIYSTTWGKSLFLCPDGFVRFKKSTTNKESFSSLFFPVQEMISFIEECKREDLSLNAFVLTDVADNFESNSWVEWMKDVLLVKEVLVPDATIVIQLRSENLSWNVLKAIEGKADVLIISDVLQLDDPKGFTQTDFDFVDYINQYRMKFKGGIRLHWRLENDTNTPFKTKELEKWGAQISQLKPQQMSFITPTSNHQEVPFCRCAQILDYAQNELKTKSRIVPQLDSSVY
ncbi:MAG: hypothetical protein HRT74_13125 [Flavobacteriales bacterium]|nr:hypothetical protein [Flavobacteriales bacterium]